MSVPDSLSEIERYVRDRADERQWISIIAATYLRLGFPALLSLSIVYKSDLGSAFIPILLVTGAIQVVSVLVRSLTGKSEKAFFEHRDLQREHDELEAKHEEEKKRSRSAIYAIEALRKASQVVIYALTANESRGNPSKLKKVISALRATAADRSSENLEKFVQEAMFPVVDLREEIFGFSEEQYNFAVYRYNRKRDVLQVLYRDVHRDIPRQDREWEPGFGHVGFCFSRREAVLSHNVTNSEELADDQSETDDEHYVSIAAAPISSLTGEDDSDPRGVLIITSNESHQFENAIHRPFLIILANILSILFHVADH